MKYSARYLSYAKQVTRKVKIGNNRALYRVSGLIRQTARRLLRVRSGAGRPGKPPHAHTNFGLRVIQFAVTGNRAVIGPMKFPRRNQWNEPVTHIHEFGGQYISRKGVMASYPERSYMATTLKRLNERNKIPKEFATSIIEVL